MSLRVFDLITPYHFSSEVRCWQRAPCEAEKSVKSPLCQVCDITSNTISETFYIRENERPKTTIYRAKLKLKTVVIGFIYSKPVGLG